MALVDSFESIIFDYGGVLVHHQTEAARAGMASRLNLPVEQFSERYWARRAEYDRADLTASAYWTEIAGASTAPSAGGTTIDERILDELVTLDAESWMQFDEVMWDWVGQLRKTGKQLAMLSNMPLELGLALKAKPGRLEQFDQVILSYDVRAVKPEPEIYEHCLEIMGAQPERTLFFDDRMENIEGAELLGIRAVQFLDRDTVLLLVR